MTQLEVVKYNININIQHFQLYQTLIYSMNYLHTRQGNTIFSVTDTNNA